MVFLHIHWTGGSTVWHSLAHLAAKHNIRVIDLYGESFMAFGEPFRTLDALSKVQADGAATAAGTDSVLLHHHTRQYIESVLPADGHRYATVLKDPVERFISDVFHTRRLLTEGAALPEEFPLYQGEVAWYREILGEPLYALFIQPEVDPDVLVTRASACPYYQNFYFNVFWSVLAKPAVSVTPEYFTGVMDDAARLALVERIRERFVYIGTSPDVAQAVTAITSLLDMPCDPEGELVHLDDGSTRPSLRSETLEMLRLANEDEYLLLAMLGMPNPAQAGTLSNSAPEIARVHSGLPRLSPQFLQEARLTQPASVAVVMPTFNSARYLAEAIESILEQSWTDLELAILDGGSTDATLDIAKAYAVKDSRISIRVYSDVHPTKRVDDFVRITQARWIAIQHSDDVSYSFRLEKQIGAFLDDPELAVNSAMYRSFWHVREKGSATEGYFIHEKPQHHDQIKANLLFWWVMHAPTLCFDREKALAVDLRFHNEYMFANDYRVSLENIGRLRYGNVQEELSAMRLHWESDGSRHQPEIAEEAYRLKRDALSRMGFNFTEEELAVHCGIALLPDRELNGPARNIQATLAWLENLREQNRRLGIVDEGCFDTLLNQLAELARAAVEPTTER
jgi:glycosyltransferase involved in cell wall biosynthesis